MGCEQNSRALKVKRYLERMREQGKEVSDELLDAFKTYEQMHAERFDAEEARENNLEYDIMHTDWLVAKIRDRESYAQNVYAALCNNEFLRLEVMPILADQRWSCTWRYAGGIIAEIRCEGDYMDWYCSGSMRSHPSDPGSAEYESLFVGEGEVTDEVREDLLKLGWKVIDDDKMV